jgi:YD repeat-containing protein
MDRLSTGLALALGSAFFLSSPSAFAAASCSTNGGISYFGMEIYAAPQIPNGAGQYLYKIAGLQCSGGKVVKWNEASEWYTPEQMLAAVKQQNPNMRRYFPNTCATHLVIYHDNFKGVVADVAASNYTGFNQTYTNQFAGPVFYDGSAELLCPETLGLGNPDLPGVCPVQSATPVLSSAGAPSQGAGDPVNLAYGNSFQTEVDYPGQPGSALRFVRYYNSKTAGWSHSYSALLKISPTKVLLSNADGRESLFTRSAGGVTGSPKELGRLEATANGWRYHSPQNERLDFNAAGQLTRIERANGAYEDLAYGANQVVVSDSLGNSLTLTFNTAKRLAGLTAGSLQVTYAYSTAGRLNKVTRTQGGKSFSRTYHYEDAREGGWLTGITDERGIRYVTWAFDAQGRAIKSELNGGNDRYQFTYHSNGSTTLTNPLGKQTTYSFQTLQGAKRITALTGAASPSCPSSNATFTYDNRGQIKTRTDNKGHVTTYSYNDRGLEESRTEAYGTPQARTITTDWHPTLFLPLVVTEPERVITYHYDDQGRQLSQTITER